MQVKIGTRWHEAMDYEIIGQQMFYELRDGRAGATHQWRESPAEYGIYDWGFLIFAALFVAGFAVMLYQFFS